MFGLTLFDTGKNQNLSKLNKTSVVEQLPENFWTFKISKRFLIVAAGNICALENLNCNKYIGLKNNNNFTCTK